MRSRHTDTLDRRAAAERESLDRLKRRIYVIILLVGLVGMILALLLGELTGTASYFGRGSLVTAAVFTTAMIWLIHFRKVSIRMAEELLYVVFGVIFLFVLFYSLYLHEPITSGSTSHAALSRPPPAVPAEIRPPPACSIWAYGAVAEGQLPRRVGTLEAEL